MKKMYKKLAIVTLIISLISMFLNINVSADTDEKTGLEYDIVYYTTVIISGYSEQEVAGGKNSKEDAPFTQYNFYQNYQLSLLDETVQADIKEHTTIIGEATSAYNANQQQEGVYVLNGQFKQIKPEDEAMYLNFLGLPSNFIGETVVDKDGFPITVVRDAKSGLKITVKSNEKGYHEKRFVIPAQERSYKVSEKVTNYTCSAGYRLPNTATATMPQDRFDTYQGKSLDDVLQHCKDVNAYDIDVTIHQSVVYTVVGYVSLEKVLVFEYGMLDEKLFNGDKNSDLTSSDTSVSSNTSTIAPKPPTSAVETTTSTESSSEVNTSSESQTETTEQLEENVQVFESEGEIEEKAGIPKWKVITPCAVFSVALAGGVYTFLRKKRFGASKKG